jgi:hypothetical protein
VPAATRQRAGKQAYRRRIMTATEVIQVFAGLSGPLFVITSMLAIGLSLTMAQARRPLLNLCLVVDKP